MDTNEKDPGTYVIIGAAMEVHWVMGPDKQVLKQFGLKKLDQIPTKQFAFPLA